MKTPVSNTLRYQDAGVSIDSGNSLVNIIKTMTKKTQQSGVVSGIGGFCSIYDPSWKKFDQPLLVSATDGVGTKLKLAIDLEQHQGIGIDLVAMCANDLLVCGATPLFFLDYYATGQLKPKQAATVIDSIATGCQQANMALIGGETAEMPGLYAAADYDLAGFCVGMVEQAQLIDGSQVQVGDHIIGIASSGPHANGYSLIRHIIKQQQVDLQQSIVANQTLAEQLITPTTIYVKPILSLLAKHSVHAMAHITGGGFYENIPRVLAPHLSAVIHSSAWPRPTIFSWLQQLGPIAEDELLRTFNCGIGMILIVSPDISTACLNHLQAAGLESWTIGSITERHSNTAPTIFIKE